ncbi:hypothetical protein QK289_12620 [Exiguobacterium antarcticum]|uniref:Uncharacterized protein n=1 Tax=Exiguobacterium antarcticum TaxID=132920 RepID=A0ABT6R4W9_9BACL|nr:hypothetical protein [Exiguobacterium antarcticum]MDI3235855.1 hypothetical protein [Exiguobacterium antarcticum]
MGLFNLTNKEYTIQYQILEQIDVVIDTDRLIIKASDHTAARKKADTLLRKQFGRTQYKIEWVQRF